MTFSFTQPLRRIISLSGHTERQSGATTHDETVFFEPCGDFGNVQLQNGGNGVLLNIEQLKLLKERSGLSDFSVEWQESGMYLVDVRKLET